MNMLEFVMAITQFTCEKKYVDKVDSLHLVNFITTFIMRCIYVFHYQYSGIFLKDFLVLSKAHQNQTNVFLILHAHIISRYAVLPVAKCVFIQFDFKYFPTTRRLSVVM